MNHFKISKTMPFAFVKNGINGSPHFNDMWACEEIRSHQIKRRYHQKWHTVDTTPLQCESSIFPDAMQLRNLYNETIKTFPWTQVIDAISYKIYQNLYDVSDVDPGIYFLYNKVSAGLITWEYLSNPIHIAPKHINTLLFEYNNTFNKDDVAWTTGIKLKFRCECDIQDYDPNTERTNYINQIKSNVLLDSIPADQFLLNVGDDFGVAPYIIHKLDRIFCCNKVFIFDNVGTNGVQYSIKQGSSIKQTRVKTFPNVGASMEIVPTSNSMSLEFADTTPAFDFGIITAYNIETDFFGDHALVPVLEVEENG